MGFTITQDPEKVEAARQFQVNAELSDLRLIDCSADMVESGEFPEGQLALSLHLETSVLNSVEGTARFAVKMIIHGDPKDVEDKPSRHVFAVACRHAITYSLKPGFTPTQEQLDAFKDGNAVFHCWPYSREFMQNLTLRMGLQVSPVPFLRLAPNSGQEKPVSKRLPRSRKASSPEKAVR